VYLAVPFKAIMNAEKVFDAPILGDTIKELNKMYNTEDQFHQLLFLLLHEKNNAASFWRPYLDILPKTHNNPVYWGPKDLKELEGTGVDQEAAKEYASLSRKYSQIKDRVFDRFPDAFPMPAFNRENYLWAHSILDSRAIWMDSQRNLVPMLDMVNCGEGPDPTKVHRSNHKMPEDTAETRASWSFEGGDQVLENYGQPNSIYFKYHGFYMEGNTHNCVDIEHEGQRFCVGGNKGLPVNLLQTVGPRGYPKKDAVVAAMKLVEAQLASYPTTLEEDMALFKDPEVKGRRKSAIGFRLEEKRALQNLLDKFAKDPTWRGEQVKPSHHTEL